MNTIKIFNLFQADYLIKNGCNVVGVGLERKAYVLFLRNNIFDEVMEIWKNREH